MSTLLVIDDDRLHCDLLQMALARHGYQVSTATGGREGWLCSGNSVRL